MRLSPDEVSRVIHKLVEEWRKSGAADVKAPDEKLVHHLGEIFLKELRVEDDLNAEVETMLEKYEKEFRSGKLDRHKMALLIKKQLAKERKIVL